MSHVDASIVIPAWNGLRYLAACLDALLAQAVTGSTAEVEIIVVDNASTDGSADLIADHYPDVRLIRNRDNLGFAGACNVGLEAARSQVLVLLNQDTRVYPGWLEALCRALQEPRVGVVGCKSLYADGETIQHAGGRIEWPLGMARHDGAGERDVGQWDVPRRAEYVTGAAMAFRSDVLEAVGLLDEGFWPGYYEDADFCYRVREAGHEVWYVPDAVLVHAETGSLAGTALLSQAFHQGRLRFVLKHLPPARFLDEFVPAEREALLSAAQGETALALRMAYLRAIPAAASLYPRRWQADGDTISRVLKALQQLYLHPVPVAGADSETVSLNQPLSEFEFRSSVPVLGPLIAGARRWWYGVAARWAVRHLARQQETINRQMGLLQERQEAMNRVYAHSLAALSEEIARLAAEAEQDGGEKGSKRA
jgi:GT2 family glycosyltransferase